MFCKNCGKEITNNDKFCKECGTPNENFVEGNPSIEEAMAQTQPYSIEDVANIVENNEPAPAVEAPAEAPAEPVVEEPVAPVTPVTENTTQTGFVPEQPVIPAAPVMESAPVQPKKKNNVAFIIIIIVLAVVILGLGAFVAYKFLGGKKDTPTVQTPSTPNEPSIPSTPSEPSTPSTPTGTTSTFTASGYKFTIPSGFEVKKSSNGSDMIVSGTTIVLGAFRTTTAYTYDYYKANLESVANSSQSSWDETGYTYKVEQGEVTIDNKKMLYIQRYNPSYKDYADVVIAELSDKTVLILEFYYKSEADADPGYKGIASMVKSAVKDSSSNFASDPSKEVNFNKQSTYNHE